MAPERIAMMRSVSAAASGSLPAPYRVGVRRGYGVSVQAPDLLLLAVGAMVLTFVWRLNNLWPGITVALRLALVSTVVALVAWLLSGGRHRRLAEVVRLTPVKILLGLVAVMLLGVPFGIYRGNSVDYLMHDYATTFLLLMLTALAIRSLKDLEFLGAVSLVGAVVYSVWVLARIEIGAAGRLGHLVYYDANDFALVLVCIMPVAAYFIRRRGAMLGRLFAVGALILFTVMLVRTGSRGGFLGFLAVMAYSLFRFKGLSVAKRIGIVAVSTITLMISSTDAFWDLMNSMLNPKQDYNYTAPHGRRQVWKRGIGYMLEHPLTGVGVRNFEKAEGRSEEALERLEAGRGFRWTSPHNSFVQIGAELGVIGLALFVGLLVGVYRRMKRIARFAEAHGHQELSAFAGGLAGALIGYVVAGFFLSQGFAAILYWLLGMAIGLEKIAGPASLPAGVPVQAGRPASSGGRNGRGVGARRMHA